MADSDSGPTPSRQTTPAKPVSFDPSAPDQDKTSQVAQAPAPSDQPSDTKAAHDVPKGKLNRLAKETSPYLLMHANNPVDWYAWGEEALGRAKKENKLIFLSIGYSSCYWCHVMERESFMDEEIAAYLNEHFICIKVDREERPDIDDVYMMALRLLSQGGGWPLSMFLTPDAKPILGGTYFPPHRKGGQAGFLDVLKHVQGLWQKQPEDMKIRGDKVAKAVSEAMQQKPLAEPPELSAKLADGVLAEFAETYDAQYGGFGFSPADPRRPKFPEPPNLVFLLDRARRHNDQKAREMLVATLEKMAGGGIRDHLGGGFHRYSTDRFWRVPHFEKMLYDNGQLTSVYAEAYALTGRADFRRVVREMLDYVAREMTDESGAFYSALDAETDEEEGRFYVWTPDELKQTLTEDSLALIAEVYGVGAGVNFENYHILLLEKPLAAIAQDRGVSEDELLGQLSPVHEKLMEARSKRERPLTDTKILTSWNGLMIGGMADAGRILKNDSYTQAAAKAADFLLANLRTPDGRLLRTYGEGKAKLNAYLDDYAFLAAGLIALHRATGDDKWLRAADALTAKQLELFWDDRAGGFFFTSHDHEALIARGMKLTDGVLPSGNAVTASNLVFLAGALEKPEYLDRAEKTIQTSVEYLQRSPSAVPRMAVALAELLEVRGDGASDTPSNK